jgi:hypothetical protein
MKKVYSVSFSYKAAESYTRTRYFQTERDYRIWLLGNEQYYIIRSTEWADLPAKEEAMSYSL